MKKTKERKYPMFRLVREFLEDYMIDIRNCSVKTVDLYRNVLSIFFSFCADREGKNLLQLDYGIFEEKCLKSFMKYLKDERGCVTATCNTYFTALRAFLAYASSRDITLLDTASEIKAIPLAKKEADLTVKHFSVEALYAILKIPDRRTSRGRRDFLLLFMLYDTACRISELLSLKVCDIVIDTSHPYLMIKGKGGKRRELPLSKQCSIYIRDYLEEHDMKESVNLYLFISERAKANIPLTSNAVRKVLTAVADKARKDCRDVPEVITPHMFRHSRAIHLYESGVPLAMVQQLLGHTDIDTTHIYAYASREMKRNALEHSTGGNLPERIQDTTNRLNSDFRDEDEAMIYFGLKKRK